MELVIVLIAVVALGIGFALSMSNDAEQIRRKQEIQRDMEMLDAMLEQAEADTARQQKALML